MERIMPAATCKTCGRMTNSATSNYAEKSGEPTECYIAVDPDTKCWVEGCAWDRAIPLVKQSLSRYLGESALPKPPPI
jgi:hypothetical protein